MTHRYLVIYESGLENWSGFAPDVPGCVATGKSLEMLRANLREALEFHIEGLALGGGAVPQAVTRLVEVPESGVAEWVDVMLPAMAVSA